MMIRRLPPNIRGFKLPASGGELATLMSFVNADDANKEDIVVDGSRIEFTSRKTLAIPTKKGIKEYGFTPYSFDQFSSMLKIPAKYLSSCSVDGKGGMKDQVEARMQNRLNKEHLVRVRNTETDDGIAGIVRAVLPGNHSIFDNRNLVTAIQRVTRDLGLKDLKLQMHNASDPKSIELGLHMRLVRENKFDIIGGGEVGDPHQIGFHARTSETGAEDICLDAIVYRLVCKNGMMGWDGSEVLRMRHRNFAAHEITPMMQEAVLSAVRQEEPIKDMLERKLHEPVANPDTELLLMGGRMKVSDFVKDQAMEVLRAEIRRGAEATRFLLMQAYTNAAQTLQMSERIKVEEAVGRITLGRAGLKVRRQDADSDAIDVEAN